MKRLLLIICLGFYMYSEVYSCECVGFSTLNQTQQIEFQNSDIVFLGEYRTIPNQVRKRWDDFTKYNFEILELYKGDYKDSIITGTLHGSSCDFMPRDSGSIWIVYGNFQLEEGASMKQIKNGSARKKNIITLYWCTISRSIDQPIPIGPNILDYKVKSPYRDENFNYINNPNYDDLIEYEIALRHMKLKASEDFKREIDWLRSKNSNYLKFHSK